MINRRQFIKGVGALSASSLLGYSNASRAQVLVDGKPSRLLLVMLNGGYAPMLTSAASFAGNTAEEMSFGFGDGGNMPYEVVGDISYDTTCWGDISSTIVDRMGCLGTVGASNHNSAHHFWKSAEGGLAQALASRMGGNSAIKAARVGDVIGAGDGSDVDGVALESVSSLESALAALNGVGDVISQDQRPIVGDIVQRTSAKNSGSRSEC